MGRGIKIFLCYVWPVLVISALVLCLLSTSIIRKIDTETGTFPQDTWEKGVFLNAEENKAVIVNLGPVDKWRFFLNQYEVKSLAYFMLNKQKSFVVSIKDDEGNLVDKIDLSRHIKSGDIVTYEWIGNNSGECKSFKICTYHSDYTFEKIPVIFQNPFRL